MVTSDSDDKQEPIKTAMGKNDTLLRKGIYMGEKISYVKKMLKLSCTDKETKESIKQFLKSNDLVLSKAPFCCPVYEYWLRIKLTKINMSSVMQFPFNGVKLYVMTINEKPWTRAKEVCRALEYEKATKAAHVIKTFCSDKNYAQKYQMSDVVSESTLDWPKDSQKYDIYINEEGMYKVVFGSHQPKAKAFKRHCCNVMFPHIR